MRRAILDLATCPELHLFEEVAVGIPLIVANAESLEAVAERLFSTGEYRASDVMRGFAEEEAAKVLILLDAVRCPAERRQDTLKCFGGHLAKRIYAMASSYPNILSFGELRHLVAHERQPYYLDGPNSVDWIFANSVTSERESAIYVDYVQDISDSSGTHIWLAPIERDERFGPYRRPESVQLARALCDAGGSAAEGVALIADTWKEFTPEDDTSRAALRQLIAAMLERLLEAGCAELDQGAEDRIVSSWSFPLWTLDLAAKPVGKTIDELREERRLTIEWIERTETQRDPRPTITRSKVEVLASAYDVWRQACDEDDRCLGRGKYATSPVRHPSEFDRHHELPSYQRLEAMYWALRKEERVALLALAWFTRDPVADWPRTYQRARDSAPTLSPEYQLGNAQDWLAGLERWEEKPSAFQPGRWYHADRRGRGSK